MDINIQGCLAEYQFATECLKRGYNVSMPLLDSSVYDCVVDIGSNIYKVQIKSTTKLPTDHASNVHVVLQNNKNQYTIDKVDYFAVFVYVFDGFFIFKNTGEMKSIRLSTIGRNSKFFNNFAFEQFS